ncbi:MAG: ATP-binding cassette domain-containing protein [Candidatus Latescibacteria bacterium]|nr:ATP-binding cassette domain-containing protein [Candidatus Latescibacterota bacterium]
MTALDLTAISKSFPTQQGALVTAVDQLSLSVPQGQVLGLLGANGAGKTTTIKMICGLITPDRGSIAVGGHQLQRQRRDALGQLGAVLEGTRNIYWRMSAWENLLYFGRLKGCRARHLRATGERLFKELDLWGRRGDLVQTFSRGMQQKTAIACALVAAPQILLLDEPTLGLDVHTTRTLEYWVRQLVEEEGRTVVLTTHQLTVAQKLSDQVAILHQGRLVTHQPVRQLLDEFSGHHYQLEIRGELAAETLRLPASWTATADPDGPILLRGPAGAPVPYELFDQLRQNGAELLSLERIEADLEEAFLHFSPKAKP